eukprot:8858900-Prorocentrum_lima.AAC.1
MTPSLVGSEMCIRDRNRSIQVKGMVIKVEGCSLVSVQSIGGGREGKVQTESSREASKGENQHRSMEDKGEPFE